MKLLNLFVLVVIASFSSERFMPHHSLIQRKHWIFDMDGTLTIAQHDFDAIRAELGVPDGIPILETLDQLPAAESAALYSRLNEIELELAHQSKPAEGAGDLLEYLSSQDSSMGILTRNNAINVGVTLQAAGLAGYFQTENILSRDCAPPKPSPAGILGLLESWQARADDAVMVGDYIFDLEAGSAAGTATIYIDPSGEFPFQKDADICIHRLSDIMT